MLRILEEVRVLTLTSTGLYSSTEDMLKFYGLHHQFLRHPVTNLFKKKACGCMLLSSLSVEV